MNGKFFIFSVIFIFNLQIFTKIHTTASNLIKYSATIFPPAFYKIAIWDKFQLTENSDCDGLFEEVEKEFNGRAHSVRLFKYFEGIELAHFNGCFTNFYTAQTNENGEFEVHFSDKIAGTIFFQTFPLDKKMDLIRSDSLPSTFLQQIHRKPDWRICVYFKQQFWFYSHKEKNTKIGQLFKHWHNANANPSDEEAFFLKAYLREIGSRVVETFTNGGALTNNEVDILLRYGRTMLPWNNDGILEEKLAQIDGMPMLVKHLCQFTINELSSSGRSTDATMDKCLVWHFFCIEHFSHSNGKRRESILKKLGIAELEEEESGTEME